MGTNSSATKIERRWLHGGLKKNTKLVCERLGGDGCLPKTILYMVMELICVPRVILKGNITVEFLDYGGRELVSLASVKALPGIFLELPFQGIHCSLKGETPLHLSHSLDLGVVW